MARSTGPDVVGWCHNCGTFQRWVDAPQLHVAYMGAGLVPCCAVCRDEEPWAFGVFEVGDVDPACAAEQHVSWGPLPCEQCGRGRRAD